MQRKSEWVTIRIEPELLNVIDSLAVQQERSRSSMIRIILKRNLESQLNQKKWHY